MEKLVIKSDIREMFQSSEFNDNMILNHDLELYQMQNKIDKEYYLIKKINFFDLESLQYRIEEIKNTAKLHHPNILEIYSYFIEKKYHEGVLISYTLYVVLENISHSLQQEILYRKASNNPFTEDEINEISLQLINVLEHLSTNNRCHGDIRPCNIFLTKKKQIKICYLGDQLINLFDDLPSSLLPSIRYLSPFKRSLLSNSLLIGRFNNYEAKIAIKSDVFSLGMTILHLITLKSVLGMNGAGFENERLQILSNIKKIYKYEIFNILELMLGDKEELRPTFSQLKLLFMMYQVTIDTPTSTSTSILTSTIIPTPKPIRKLKKVVSIEMKLFEDFSENYSVNLNESYLEPDSMRESISFENVFIDEDVSQIYKQKSKETSSLPRRPIVFFEKTDKGSLIGDLCKEIRSASFAGIDDFGEEIKIDFDLKLPINMKKDNERQFLKNSSPMKKSMLNNHKLFIKDEIFIENEKDLHNLIDEYRNINIRFEGPFENETTIAKIKKLLEHQKNLQNLSISICKAELGDAGVLELNQAISKMTNLQTIFLELRRNNIGNLGLNALSRVFGSNLNFTSIGIDLSSNLITSNGIIKISDGLMKQKELKSLALNFSNNKIGKQGIALISNCFQNFNKIESMILYLYSNNLDNIDLQSLLGGIKKMEKLSNLSIDLSDNLLTDEGMEILKKYLKPLAKLGSIEIDLKGNFISENCKNSLVSLMKKSDSLIINLT